MDRRPRHFRCLVLTLVAVLAWPWGLELLRWDADPVRDAAGAAPALPLPVPGGPRIARAKTRLANGRPALLQTDSQEAEEGDEVCPPATAFVPALAPLLSSPRAAGAQEPAAYPPPGLSPVSRPFPLRC